MALGGRQRRKTERQGTWGAYTYIYIYTRQLNHRNEPPGKTKGAACAARRYISIIQWSVRAQRGSVGWAPARNARIRVPPAAAFEFC